MALRAHVAVAALGLLALLLVGCGGEGSSTPTSGSTPTSAPSGQTVELHPIAGGFKPNDLTFADCPSAAEPSRCLEQAYGNFAYRAGPKPALRRVAGEMATKPEVESNCHRIVHVIGSASLARAKGDVGNAFTQGDSTCWSGYYHGILERALYGATNDTLLAAAVRRICARVLREKTRFIAYQCVHGVGHGLMIQTGLDLPRSLEHCDRLETEWERTSCDGGVFMENFNTSYAVKSRYVKDDDLLYPCNGVAERHKLYCYLQITDRVLGATSYDWKRAAALCTTAEPAWRATCFQSFGRNASGVARNDQARLLGFCAIPTRKWQGDCVFGAVRDIASIDAGADRALRFCSAVTGRLQARCYYGLGTILSDLTSDAGKLAVACAAAPPRFRPECRLLRPA